jgi:DNA-directed RNA polymerase subunit RPC12/RpoP
MDRDKLYDEIVAIGVAEVKGIAARIVREGDVSDGNLARLEFVIRRMMFDMGVKMLKPVLDEMNGGWQGNSIRCACGGRAMFKGRREAWVDTILGALRLKKAYYYCSRCGRGLSPLDEMLQLKDGRTAGARRLISLAGVADSFEKGARLLDEMSGLKVSDNTVERLSEQSGAEAMEREDKGDDALLGEVWQRGSAEKMCVTVDGTTAQMRGYWREFKVGAIYGEAKGRKRYYTTLKGSSDFMLELRRSAMQKGLGCAKEVAALGDGGAWIWKEFEINFPMATQILDFWHLMEHIFALAGALWGEESREAKRWAEDARRLLKQKGGVALLTRLDRLRARRKKKAERDEIDKLIKYLGENRGRTAYDQYIKRGLDIGSGPVEAACKTLIGQRLKSSGMRWTEEGAEKIARLRAIHLSGLWDEFWGFTTAAA